MPKGIATREERKTSSVSPEKTHPREHFINRELSWLEFNARVLEEALDPNTPLLERVKFISIFSSNLDEFFMIRVSGLRRLLERGALAAPPDGMTAAEQLAEIRRRLTPLIKARTACWHDILMPELRRAGVRVLTYEELDSDQADWLRSHFEKEIFPILTPLAFDPGHPFPHISNLSINLAVTLNDPRFGERFARVKIPSVIPRLIALPSRSNQEAGPGLEGSPEGYIWLEDVVSRNLDMLFPGLEVADSFPFRVTRDADIEIEEDEASDLLEAVEEVERQRHFGFVVRLQVDCRMPQRLREILASNLELKPYDLKPYQVYAVKCPLDLSHLMELTRLDRPDLKYPPFLPAMAPSLTRDESIFSVLKRRDLLLYHPYDSFNPVVEFVQQAAEDPDVLAIKQTLYRVGANSPIVEALKEARESGKQVAVLVELKARFDEARNVVWARELERAGVHVVYGVLGLKTHAKMCLVVRRERDGIRRYVHLGTGNYNPVTARLYTDLGYLTSDPAIAEEVSILFNAVTGYSAKDSYKKVLVAPGRMRQQLLDRIRREIESHRSQGDGHIVLKCNALVDKACIKALYEASQAGVQVDLQVRGICCLRPGMPGISENVRVTSIVGRFLEHTRIYYFRNGGQEEILLGSADLMPRNLRGRIEVLFPVEDPHLLQALKDEILFLHLRDNVQSRRLLADGSYERVVAQEGEERIDSQAALLEERGSWHDEE